MNANAAQHAPDRSFGTYPLKGDELVHAMHAAIRIGFRSIDTAQGYGNEADVGRAIASSSVPRAELYITTKVNRDNFAEDKFLPSVQASLEALGVDQVDALLLHWPPEAGDFAPVLNRLEKAANLGLARHIGLSNFTAAMMKSARKIVGRPLVTNQVEFHPLVNQSVLLATAKETGIPLSAYCALARGEVFKYPVFNEIAQAHGRNPAQIVLRWILQKGVAFNAMSTRPANLQANFDVLDFELSPADMQRIDAMNTAGFRVVDRPRIPYAPVWD